MISYDELRRLRTIYINSNMMLKENSKLLNVELPPRYYMNLGCIEIIDYLLEDK